MLLSADTDTEIASLNVKDEERGQPAFRKILEALVTIPGPRI